MPDGHYEASEIVDIGDGCTIKVEINDYEEHAIGLLSLISEKICPTTYALSRSGSSVLWKNTVTDIIQQKLLFFTVSQAVCSL